ANQTLSPIFNKEKEQQWLQEAQKISEIALQAADIAATQGKFKATRAANDNYHQALTESGFGTGGKVRQAIQAATAAVQGMAGGNIGAAIAGGAAVSTTAIKPWPN
ncbi:hypothetical protein ACQPT3_17635, partial [Erwinia amylovora]